MYPFFLCCGIKKVEPTHGTLPAAGIASFRSTTTKYNIPSKTKAVPPCIQIIQIPISSFHIVIIRIHSITNNSFCRKQVNLSRFRHSFHHINDAFAQLADTIVNPNITTSELHQILGISETAVENNLTFLKENGYVERVGSKKTGYWKVLE